MGGNSKITYVRDSTERDLVPIRDSSPIPSPKDSSASRTAITPQRPVKVAVAPTKAEDRAQDSSSDSSSLSNSSPSSSSSVGASSPPSSRALPLSELHRRLTSLTDENVIFRSFYPDISRFIFRVAEILLTHPTASTMLLPSRPSISFDLTTADAALVAKLSHALMS
ncbi:hypothetical protein OESDEN_12500 [Oesophagostomum dentatum]|uniref:Uncharacterized protein n=1 Tax=Oesophagostomum dentatum TaxID=61180 RepID=A0A0B1SS00_OESDE|nr:hypothetical protein OESDEN_12500 [Oesophagostomum dentatum]